MQGVLGFTRLAFVQASDVVMKAGSIAKTVANAGKTETRLDWFRPCWLLESRTGTWLDNVNADPLLQVNSSESTAASQRRSINSKNTVNRSQLVWLYFVLAVVGQTMFGRQTGLRHDGVAPPPSPLVVLCWLLVSVGQNLSRQKTERFIDARSAQFRHNPFAWRRWAERNEGRSTMCWPCGLARAAAIGFDPKRDSILEKQSCKRCQYRPRRHRRSSRYQKDAGMLRLKNRLMPHQSLSNRLNTGPRNLARDRGRLIAFAIFTAASFFSTTANIIAEPRWNARSGTQLNRHEQQSRKDADAVAAEPFTNDFYAEVRGLKKTGQPAPKNQTPPDSRKPDNRKPDDQTQDDHIPDEANSADESDTSSDDTNPPDESNEAPQTDTPGSSEPDERASGTPLPARPTTGKAANGKADTGKSTTRKLATGNHPRIDGQDGITLNGKEVVMESLRFNDSGFGERNINGGVIVEAADGGVLMLAEDGRLWPIDKADLRERLTKDVPFRLWNSETMSAKLKDELGEQFEVINTRHYVIATNAGRDYAKWCGNLFERLQTAFLTFWNARGVKLQETSSPLSVIVFATREQFAEYATRDAGPAIAGTQGYYSITSNRIILFDLTALPNGQPAQTPDEFQRRLTSVLDNVVTVVHEATHQVAFNTGLHRRYADNPQWVTEGMAMFFETPDLRSRTGWKTIGTVNRNRLARFRNYAQKRRPNDSLVTLITSEERLMDPERNIDAYSEAWCLTYFLIKTRRTQYTDYINSLRRKERLVWDGPEQRLEEFREAFGEDLQKLDADMLRFLNRLDP